MAASLVQRTRARGCKNGGRVHCHDHNIATDSEIRDKLGSGLLSVNLNQPYAAPEHCGSTTPTATSSIGANHHVELIESRMYPFKGHAKHTCGQHTPPAAGYHLYLLPHVYDHRDVGALRSISFNVSAASDNGLELKRAEEPEGELNEYRAERERLIVMKQEVDLMIHRLEENVKRVDDEHERRVKGELVVEKEEHQKELSTAVKKGREEHERNVKEEARRLNKADGADLETKKRKKSKLEGREQRSKVPSVGSGAGLERARGSNGTHGIGGAIVEIVGGKGGVQERECIESGGWSRLRSNALHFLQGLGNVVATYDATEYGDDLEWSYL